MDEPKLSKDTIVAEAVALLHESGLDGISLRRLAARLGVRAPSLYWHFPDKNAVLDAVMEHIFNRSLDSIPDHREWRSWMRAFGEAMLKTQDEVPDFGRLITMTNMADDHFERTIARIRARLVLLDMPLDAAIQLQSAIQALVAGWSAFTHAPYADKLRDVFDLEAVAGASLDALIDGWQWQRPEEPN